MAYPYEYPYTDPNRHNDDWAMKQIKDLDNKVNTILSGAIVENFNKLMIDAIYSEPDETITLKREIIAGDGVHVYSADTNTMTIDN